MRKLLMGSAIAAVLSLGTATAVEAQANDSTVIMRRPLVSKTRAFEWTVDQWSECSNSCGVGQQTRKAQCLLNGQYVYPDQHCTSQKPAEVQSCTSFAGCNYQWEEKSSWTDVKGCGEVVETREMQCRRSDGTVVGRDACAQPVPEETRKVRDLETCSYSWDPKAWSSFSSECAAEAVRTRKVDCLRSNGEIAAESFCKGEKPSASETAERTSQCGYSWKEKEWSAFDSSCSTTARRTRDVVCLRSDGVEVAEGMCSGAGAKPALSDVQPQYGSCSYSWTTGQFGEPAPACGDTTSSRTVQCLRSNGDVVDDASCSAVGAKPSTTEKRTDYSTCTYGYVEGSWGPWSNTCGQGTRSRDVSCMSSDGRKVDDDKCTDIKPGTSESDYRVEGCTMTWQSGEWSRVPGCGASSDIRTPTCLRSDGQTVADAQCALGSKPDVSRPATDYQTCTFSWANGEWGNWTSSCGQAAHYRDVWCQSSDGRRVADASCTGTKPDIEQAAYQTSGCGYEWVGDPFSAPVPACGATTQSRVTWCKRSDGERVMDMYCQQAGLPQPSNTQPATDYATCGYRWDVGGWSAPSSSCGQATQSRSVTCLRSDNTTVPDGSCSAVGIKPETTQATLQTSSCSYTAVNPSAWSGYDNACSATAKRTRTFQCLRGDGVIVPDSECTSRGVSLVGSETGPNYTNACPGYFTSGAWSDYNSHCSGSATRTRTVTCFRSGDNVFAGDQYCTDRGLAVPARSETGPVFDQCGYTWQTGAFGAPAAACGASAQYRAVWCRRGDGATVSDSSCPAASRPADAQSATDYSACSYAWAENGWRTTSQTCGSTSQTHDVWCRRADGATVADAYCPAGRPANDRSYTDYSSCSYAWTPGSFSTPSACGSTTATRAVPCTRQDGAVVAASYCGATAQPTTTQTTSDYSACGYLWKTGAFGAVTPACGASSQSRDVWCERTDGQRVADGSCGGGKPAVSQPANNYDACTYYPVDRGRAACSMQGRQDQYWDCTRSDGTPNYPAAYCGKTNPESVACPPPYTYAAHDHGAGACQSNNTRPHYWDCMRNDGQDGFPASYCGRSNPEYDYCTFVTYSWAAGGWSDWNNHCTSNATQTRDVYCAGSDGSRGADSQCGGARPIASQSGPVYDQCGYQWQAGGFGGFGGCSASCGGGTQTQYRDVWCQRSDGAHVDGSSCGGGQPGNSNTQSCNTQACVPDDAYHCVIRIGSYAAGPQGAVTSGNRNCVRYDGYNTGTQSFPGESQGISSSLLPNQYLSRQSTQAPIVSSYSCTFVGTSLPAGWETSLSPGNGMTSGYSKCTLN